MTHERVSDEQEILEEDWSRFVENSNIEVSNLPTKLVSAAKQYFILNSSIRFEDVQEKSRARRDFFDNLNLSEADEEEIQPILSAITHEFSLN